MRLAPPAFLMEMILQRWSWAFNLGAVLLGAFLAARTVNTIAATTIAPKPALLQQAVNAPLAAQGQLRTELDADKVAKLFDVPLPKPVTADGPAPEPVKAGWNPVPV